MGRDHHLERKVNQIFGGLKRVYQAEGLKKTTNGVEKMGGGGGLRLVAVGGKLPNISRSRLGDEKLTMSGGVERIC